MSALALLSFALSFWPPSLEPVRLATERSAVLLQRPASLVRCTGAGRRTFLHGLVTADVKSLSGVADAAVVDASGRTLSTLTLVDRPVADTILALGPPGRGGAVAEFFEK